ncbi:MAG: O-antigen ligase family protein [Salibacteraceae bacterium]
MKYKAWKLWVKQLPLSMKWFVVLILLRPIIDVFYFLKEISPLVSPLYIVGILTPVLIGVSFLSRKFPKKLPSLIIDTNFGLWSLIVIFNLLLLFVIETGFQLVGNLLRYTAPILLYFYLRHFIKSKKDMIGLLQTFFYSAIIPATFLFYELIVSPINPEYLSAGRGGEVRMQGAYADIMNYAIYALGALLIRLYFYLRLSQFRKARIKDKIMLLVVILSCFAGLVAIKQSSSWAVGLFIGFLFLVFSMRNIKGVFVVILMLPFLLFIGQKVFNSKIEPLIQKEYKVLDGSADVSRSFNGRMSRWIKYFDIWSEMSVTSNLLGAPISGNKKASVMISGGMHSDYVRVLFLSGIIGLSLYLLFLFNIIRRFTLVRAPEKFLIIGVVVTIALLSISTTPLLYVPFTYYIFPILAYVALPKPILLSKDV